MGARSALICVVSLIALTVPARAQTPGPPSGKPAITITSPRDGATISGSTLTVRVHVSHFKLVKPTLLSPSLWSTIPLLKGNQGHIHYVLDSPANLVLTRDVVVMTSHTWVNVPPGKHTIIAYLATSQHAPFPGASPARIHVTLVTSPRAQAPKAPPAVPSIKITRVQATHTGKTATLLVRVRISHFKLVPPVYVNPPLLRGNQGHVHYVLDNLKSFVATRDAVNALSHPWSNVTPGRHTIIAYLATSQHQLFPGTKPAEVRVDIPAAGSPGQKVNVRVGNLPVTGGGFSGVIPGLDAGGDLWLAAVLGLGAAGYACLRRRRRSP